MKPTNPLMPQPTKKVPSPNNLNMTTPSVPNGVLRHSNSDDEKRNTKQTDQPHQEMKTNDQEMKSMSRTYRYTQENHTPKNRQKRSGKNKLEWNTFREQSRDVSEMSKIEGFHGN
tara:strand:+ start:67 stop:411 length:345 start_codon:yes stop_codon:yes gene_type:complete